FGQEDAMVARVEMLPWLASEIAGGLGQIRHVGVGAGDLQSFERRLVGFKAAAKVFEEPRLACPDQIEREGRAVLQPLGYVTSLLDGYCHHRRFKPGLLHPT